MYAIRSYYVLSVAGFPQLDVDQAKFIIQTGNMGGLHLTQKEDVFHFELLAKMNQYLELAQVTG